MANVHKRAQLHQLSSLQLGTLWLGTQLLLIQKAQCFLSATRYSLAVQGTPACQPSRTSVLMHGLQANRLVPCGLHSTADKGCSCTQIACSLSIS